MADAAIRERLRPLVAGVRFRATVAAVLVVGVVLGTVVLIIGVAARERLESSVSSAVETRAEDLAALIAADGVGDVLAGRDDAQFAQVVDSSGRVIAASPGLEGLPPLVSDRLAPGHVDVMEIDELFDDSDVDGDGFGEETEGDIDDDAGPHIVLVRGVATPTEPMTVIVGASLEPTRRVLGALQPFVVAGLPIVSLSVGVLVWSLVGRALRPVEAIREQADSISAQALDRRLPEPDSRDEVHRLAATLNDMLERLETSAVRQREFVADASHELKTPIAAIRTMLEVADRDPEFADWRRLLEDLTLENRRSETLVYDLLTLAAGDEPDGRLKSVEVDLDQVAGVEADELRRRTGVRLDSSQLFPTRVVGDPDSLRRLVANLLDNAGRYATSGVWVESRVEDAFAVLRVSDDGPGIPEADRDRVFERFVRLDEVRARDTGGTGLGLAVARAVARRHGGDVAVVDPLRGGATLEVRLPLAVDG